VAENLELRLNIAVTVVMYGSTTGPNFISSTV